jgi:cysteinyl-tRNA synthetase
MVWDVFRRYLEHRGLRVQFVQNFTDIDDKIIARAQAEGSSPEEIALKYTAEYFTDMDALGVRRATAYPKATETVAEMITHIQGLIEKGLAYVVDGDVYFRVAGFPGYGKLSGRTQGDNEAGARVDVDMRKQDPADFALWKAAKPLEPAWESPWGPGRPGWHIECSAMVRRILGDTIDIHAGGKDLKFPHHENEIAQSEGLTGQPFVRVWLHTGFLNMGTEKMSKSMGNILTTRDVIAAFGAQPLRYFMLQTLYRSDLDFTEEAVQAAATGLGNWRETLARLESASCPAGAGDLTRADTLQKQVVDGFNEAMDNDFNTAAGLAHLNRMTNHLRRLSADATAPLCSLLPALQAIRNLAHDVLGLDLSPVAAADRNLSAQASAFLQLLVDLRTAAKAEKNWALADTIRHRLLELDVRLVDQKDGSTSWEPATRVPAP